MTLLHDADPTSGTADSRSADPTQPTQPTQADQVLDGRTRLLLDRRNLLRVGGLVAVVGGGAALAACTPATQTPTTTPSSAGPSSAPASSAPPSSAAPSSAAPSSASSSAPAPSGPSVAAADVPVGSGAFLPEPNQYVVTQPTKGQYKAFTSICTHQGCPMKAMQGDFIHCDCHQSNFSITDGAPTSDSKATEPLEEFQVTVSGGKVYVQA